jgi:hypothetical protein
VGLYNDGCSSHPSKAVIGEQFKFSTLYVEQEDRVVILKVINPLYLIQKILISESE